MPPVSEKQRRAMYATAAGRSTLGIPRSVGREFVAADKGGKLALRKKPMRRRGSGILGGLSR
jgi:hypothetical protein